MECLVGLRGGHLCSEWGWWQLALGSGTRECVRPPGEVLEGDREGRCGGWVGGLAVLAERVRDERNEHGVAQGYRLFLDGDQGEVLDGARPGGDAAAVADEATGLLRIAKLTNTLSSAFFSWPGTLWLYSAVTIR